MQFCNKIVYFCTIDWPYPTLRHSVFSTETP